MQDEQRLKVVSNPLILEQMVVLQPILTTGLAFDLSDIAPSYIPLVGKL